MIRDKAWFLLMNSPFPGMDPYLENPELWSAVHSRLIVSIADYLVDHLSEQYRIEVEKRIYFSSDEESLLVGIPDVLVATQAPTVAFPASATLTLPTQPEKVRVPLSEEVQERYLEIREVSTGTVVTVIELLSPRNKRPGEGRLAYERKRNQILASTTHLVEIDLLRGGQPFPMVGQSVSNYPILICRSHQKPIGDLYAFSLRQPIPAVPIPLLPGEAEPILDLQLLLTYVYGRGRYHLAIDYSQPPKPPFSKEDAAWVANLLQPRL